MSEQVQGGLAEEVEALTPQQRERLRVDHGHFQPLLSPEQMERLGKAMEERRAQAIATSNLLTPSHQAEVRKEVEARLEAERKATWPDPRAALRSSHAELAEAKAEIIRKREVLDRAKQHLAATQAQLATVEGEAKAREDQRVAELTADLSNGNLVGAAAPGLPKDDPTLGYWRGEAATAGVVVDNLTAALAEAEAGATRAEGAIVAAAEQVLLDHSRDLTDKLSELKAQVATVSASLEALCLLPKLTRGPGESFSPLPVSSRVGRILHGEQRATRAAPNWQQVVKALLADPEAVLPE
jgi:hypothetical protein